MSEHEQSKPTHTPGPWDWWRDGDRIHVIAAGSLAYVSPSQVRADWIAELDPDCTDHTPETTEANARLIAAAPDLLEALIGVVAVADRKTVEFDKARAAIAKAEGGAA